MTDSKNKYLLISLSNLNLAEYKTRYSIIRWDKRLHMLKNLSQIGTADIIFINLKHSVIRRKNIILNYLNQQDLSDFVVIYIYGRTRYKSIFNHYNHCYHQLPKLNGQSLDAVLNPRQPRSRANSISVSLNETHSDVETDDETQEDDHKNALHHILCLKRIYGDMEMELESLRKQLGSRESKESKVKEPEKKSDILRLDNVKEPLEIKEEPPKLQASLRFNANAVMVFDGYEVVKTFPFRNAIERRRMSRQAKRFLQQLL